MNNYNQKPRRVLQRERNEVPGQSMGGLGERASWRSGRSGRRESNRAGHPGHAEGLRHVQGSSTDMKLEGQDPLGHAESYRSQKK